MPANQQAAQLLRRNNS